MSSQDIARLIGPEVRKIGEPSCLRPQQIHSLILPFLPDDKHKDETRSNHVLSFQNLVFSKTIPQFEEVWRSSVIPFPEFRSYLVEIGKERFAPVYFAGGKHQNRTTNAVEGFWKTAESLRYSPFILPFFDGMYRLAREQVQSAVARTQTWTGALTPWASEALESIRRDIQLDGKMESPPTIRFHPTGRADVIEIKTRHTFTCEVRTRKCSCQTRDSFAVPCRHLVFVADHLRCPSIFLFAECYRTNSWREMLNSTTFPHLNINLGQLTAQNSFLPAIYGKTRGRTAKKRISTHPGIRKPRSATDNVNSTDDNLDPESFWSQFAYRPPETLTSASSVDNSAPFIRRRDMSAHSIDR